LHYFPAAMAEIPNAEVAAQLEAVGQLLADQGANVYRSRAYLRAAQIVRSLERPVAELLREEGEAGLDNLPGIGPNLARAIRDVVLTGRLPMLERLRGEGHPVELLASIPGIGELTAERLHQDLGIDTLEELEVAAYDGRLEELRGLGGKRLAGIRESLAQRLGRRHPSESTSVTEPPVAEILDVDREYREKAAAGMLYRITPRRQNPRHDPWLPVLHSHRGGRHYTALFSNTPRAHQLGMTRDWVIIYDDGVGHHGRQRTVITAQFGPLAGKRIVRGREGECATYYAQSAATQAAP